jgi:16S rRNA (cytosine1402-N4)-methyltransferase
MAHTPVLLGDVLTALQPKPDGRYVDGTFGGGGYTRALLEAAPCRVLALDRDPDAIARGQPLVQAFGGRLVLQQAVFSDIDQAVARNGFGPLDGVVLDLGVSSFQLDEGARGFSFMRDGPLDMRMSASGPSAADIVATASEEELADIFYHYGDEHHSRRIAARIVAARKETPFTRTLPFAEAVASAVPGPRGKIHPATRVFQALRIVVNDELGELRRVLEKALSLLKVGGRLVVVTFHSLEDRIVKVFFKEHAEKRVHINRYKPVQKARSEGPRYREAHKPVEPTHAECARNPRARSARLRTLERVA